MRIINTFHLHVSCMLNINLISNYFNAYNLQYFAACGHMDM